MEGAGARGSALERDRRAISKSSQSPPIRPAGKGIDGNGDEGTLNTETKNFVLANRSEPLVIHTRVIRIYTTIWLGLIRRKRYARRIPSVSLGMG